MADLVLGMEIGGTKLQAALGTREGNILAIERGAAPAAKGAEGILEWFKTAVPTLLASDAAGQQHPAAMGVGFGGPVDSATGSVLKSHQVGGWDGFPLKQWFESQFKLPVSVVNDSNAAGWAEFCLGAGRGTQHFCYMNIGSGIGGALVIDGKLHDGQGRGAAEIGHTCVPAWTSAKLGAAGKLENICSGWAIEKRIRQTLKPTPGSPLERLCEGDPNTLTCAMLGEAARQHDAMALEELERVAESIGIALANVITLVHPERAALGGGVSLLGDVLLNPIRDAVARHVFGPYAGRYEILPCQLGEHVVTTGALLLAPA